MPWSFPIARRLNSFFFGTSKSSKKLATERNKERTSFETISSSVSSSSLSDHSITQKPAHSSTSSRVSSPLSDAPRDFTYRLTTSSGKGRETFILADSRYSLYAYDKDRETVTEHDIIGDDREFSFSSQAKPASQFRITTSSPGKPMNLSPSRESISSSLSSKSSTSRSQSPKIAVPAQKINLTENKIARSKEIAGTEVKLLTEEDHQKINTEIQKNGSERLHVATFYIMSHFFEKLNTEEMKQKYPELKDKEIRQTVAGRMADIAIKEQQRQTAIRSSINPQRSSLFSRSSAFSTNKKSS